MAQVEEWWKSIPPITRTYVSLAVVTTASVALDIVTPYKLYLNWELVLRHLHVWRIGTNFLFFGNLSLDFLFHMFFLYRYCKMLETHSFRGRTADFLYMLIFGGTLLLLISPLTTIEFLGPSLTFMMVYVWSRRNSRQPMNFLGLLNFRAPYLPWVLLLFSTVLGSSPSMDLLGVLAGHIYYYCADVYPLMAGVNLLKTPKILHLLVGGNDDDDDDAPNFPQQQQPQPQQRQGVAAGFGRMLAGDRPPAA